MNCNDVRENLIELLAEGPAAPAVRDHLGQCKECAQELESLRKTMALLDVWEAPEPSPYFMTRFQAHVKEEREKAPAGWRAWLRRPALAVSLVAVLAAGGVMYQVLRPPIEQVADGAAVHDLEALEKNHDLYVNSDLLDDVAGLNPQQTTSTSQ